MVKISRMQRAFDEGRLSENSLKFFIGERTYEEDPDGWRDESGIFHEWGWQGVTCPTPLPYFSPSSSENEADTGTESGVIGPHDESEAPTDVLSDLAKTSDADTGAEGDLAKTLASSRLLPGDERLQGRLEGILIGRCAALGSSLEAAYDRVGVAHDAIVSGTIKSAAQLLSTAELESIESNVENVLDKQADGANNPSTSSLQIEDMEGETATSPYSVSSGLSDPPSDLSDVGSTLYGGGGLNIIGTNGEPRSVMNGKIPDQNIGEGPAEPVNSPQGASTASELSNPTVPDSIAPLPQSSLPDRRRKVGADGSDDDSDSDKEGQRNNHESDHECAKKRKKDESDDEDEDGAAGGEGQDSEMKKRKDSKYQSRKSSKAEATGQTQQSGPEGQKAVDKSLKDAEIAATMEDENAADDEDEMKRPRTSSKKRQRTTPHKPVATKSPRAPTLAGGRLAKTASQTAPKGKVAPKSKTTAKAKDISPEIPKSKTVSKKIMGTFKEEAERTATRSSSRLASKAGKK